MILTDISAPKWRQAIETTIFG